MNKGKQLYEEYSRLSSAEKMMFDISYSGATYQTRMELAKERVACALAFMEKEHTIMIDVILKSLDMVESVKMIYIGAEITGDDECRKLLGRLPVKYMPDEKFISDIESDKEAIKNIKTQ